jgi:hypothetical protein
MMKSHTPDGSAVVGAVSQKVSTPYLVEGQIEDILQDEVAVLLHLDALDVVPLLGSVLEDARASGVDGDLAVALALELDAAVRAPEALADEEPLAVAEDAVTLRHDDGWWWWWWW